MTQLPRRVSKDLITCPRNAGWGGASNGRTDVSQTVRPRDSLLSLIHGVEPGMGLRGGVSHSLWLPRRSRDRDRPPRTPDWVRERDGESPALGSRQRGLV